MAGDVVGASGAISERRFIGIDPGLRRSGYGVIAFGSDSGTCVVEAGVIRLDPKQSVPARLLELERALEELITLHQPAVLCCEGLYSHYRHPQTAVLMGHARGVVLLVAARRGLEILDVAATQVKKTLTGSGHAGKEQMQRAVATMLSLPSVPEPHDVADALAVALCGREVHGMQSADSHARRRGGRP